MPKKTVTKTTAKTQKRSSRKTSSPGETVIIHRVFIIASVLALFVVAGVFANKQLVKQSVLGASVVREFYDQATIVVPNDIPDAASYNLYYRQVGEKNFNNSVQNVSPSAGTYTISYLKRGGKYEYRFAAVDATGKEFAFSEVVPIINLHPMQ